VDDAVEAAAGAREAWRATTALERAERVIALAELVERHRDELAVLDCLSTGSPISNARNDVTAAIKSMRMFAGLVLEVKGQTIPASSGLHLTVREPVGVVAKIFPFNHPLLFACGAAVPMLAGNPTVLKPPETAALSVLRLAELASQVFPPGVLSVVVGDGPRVPDRLVRHRQVRRIGFIGSEPTGLAIQRAAAESAVKQVSLELGGKNAMVVFADADLEDAAEGAVRGMNFAWSGQSCGSSSRLLVQRGIYDELLGRVVALVQRRRFRDPLDEDCEQGALANRSQFDKTMSYIEIARSEGARLVTGGGRPDGEQFQRGWFVAPTIFADVAPGMRIAQEEVFGPVLSVIPFDDEDEAVRIANGVEYGLTASVWTRDLVRAHRMAAAFEAGFVWINDSSRHYPNVPFGGVKSSGFGREESLDELLSYTELKSINIRFPPDPA
jgi:2-formylbenzoate dehydrogenase